MIALAVVATFAVVKVSQVSRETTITLRLAASNLVRLAFDANTRIGNYHSVELPNQVVLAGGSVTRSICIANQKGGVGKTTTAINLATALALSGQPTLLVDMDPQCNATSGTGVETFKRHPLIDAAPMQESCQATPTDNLYILPGSRNFQDIDRLANGLPDLSERVVQHLTQGVGQFEYVIVDCPPSLGALTQTALRSSSEVLMPIQCEYFAMEGLSQMITLIRDIMMADPGSLEFGGILLTMYDENLELTSEVENQVREFFGEIVFDTVIPRDVAVSEAPSHGCSVLDYSPRSRGSRAYIELCMEVVEHDAKEKIGAGA